MSAWMNDAVPNHNGNGFPHMNDPNSAAAMMDPSAFMANPGQFNPGQFPNQQQMAGMQNGPMRHGSPTYQSQNQPPNPNPNQNQNPVYQTNQVIPSKRPRPREDSVTGSPLQNPGMQPPSRSETPQQQNFGAFQPAGGAMPPQAPGQFPHLQPNGSANASPSPIMGNQMRPGNVPQRVATASPHPFSPGPQQQFTGSQASPIPSEHGTPQPNSYMQAMPPGYNPGYAQSPSNPRPSPNPNAMASGPAPGAQMIPQQMGQMPQHMGQMPPNMYQQMQQQQQQPGQPQSQQGQPRPQGMTDQQKMAAYQMRLHQHLQGNMQMQPQMQTQNMGRGMMPKQQMSGIPNGQVPQGAMRQQPRPMGNINPEHFMKNLVALMNAKGLPLDPNPIVVDRQVSLVMLFQVVQSKGGYKAVTTGNGWGFVAQALGLPAHIPTVPPTLKQVYERNLAKFEEVWITQQQKHRMMQQNANMAGPGTPQKQMQPAQQMNQGQMPQGQQQQTPIKPGQAPVNGFSTPQPSQQQPHLQQPLQQPHLAPHAQQQQAPLQHQHQHQHQHQQQQPQPQHTSNSNAKPGHRSSMSRGADASAPNDFSIPSPSHARPGSVSVDGRQATPLPAVGADDPMPRMPPKPEDYSPCARELSTYGGIDTHAANLLGAELERWEPTVPSVNELGNIDISALTRSLQCGIHGEVRLALDTLATISSSPNQAHFLHLRACDDLVEALVDCAETQIDLLVEHATEVADEIQLASYEDVVRACRIERWAVTDVPAFGSIDYQLDRAVDRLICITTILRNVSFPGENNENHYMLCEEYVVKMLCSVIRYLGTRTMLLRTHANTLDFMKDVVVFLSNISSQLEIPGREQALSLLHFLLAFAPVPGPTMASDTLNFTPYDPSIHSYLPHAVDALAKLLARDEPNRGFYKALFTVDSSSPLANELLVRAFALAISPLPDKAREQLRPSTLPPLFEARKPFLMQGLLGAEIIASLVPGSESGMARALLASGNCLAQNLVKLIQNLCILYEKPPPSARGVGRAAAARKDPELVYIVAVAVSLLRRLAEKARDSAGSASAGIGDLLPQPQVLMDALMMQSPEWTKEGLLPQLTAVLNLDG
ncbi:ARID/BRIGHT DNA binding domain containing protein [Metarhizium album ARSEF 1941]|uniref:ARID/BRIGHT DNA binding domain containing protein n=1 Tax=Metarhizium album (strain ARSEF 1941) TaxID=1081103 RepID=A0A0B2WM84_METAS|nr:ARID/BRIGHT DNA binding domain containing protein [Metarhizium album ARSEF 1941]KHN97166.1 ARID/BRIGHT DNA binding domain containing protein [Metarhizium album ARSEF 1941]